MEKPPTYYVRSYMKSGGYPNKGFWMGSVLHTDPNRGFLKGEPKTVSGSCTEGVPICERCDGKWKGRLNGKLQEPVPDQLSKPLHDLFLDLIDIDRDAGGALWPSPNTIRDWPPKEGVDELIALGFVRQERRKGESVLIVTQKGRETTTFKQQESRDRARTERRSGTLSRHDEARKTKMVLAVPRRRRKLNEIKERGAPTAEELKWMLDQLDAFLPDDLPEIRAKHKGITFQVALSSGGWKWTVYWGDGSTIGFRPTREEAFEKAERYIEIETSSQGSKKSRIQPPPAPYPRRGD